MASVNGLQSIKSYRLTGTVTRGRVVKADGVSGGIAAAAQATGGCCGIGAGPWPSAAAPTIASYGKSC